MSPDRLNPIRSERDLEPALEIARGLIGQTCWDADAPMESLFLYLGEKREWRGALIGAWQLSLADTPWNLLDGERLLAQYERLDTREAMSNEAAVLLGTTVTDLHIDYHSLGLTVTFDDRFRLVVDPTRIQEDEQENSSEVRIAAESQWLYEVGFLGARYGRPNVYRDGPRPVLALSALGRSSAGARRAVAPGQRGASQPPLLEPSPAVRVLRVSASRPIRDCMVSLFSFTLDQA